MSFVVLLSAPYMVKEADRFGEVLKKFGISLLIPKVEERMEEEHLLEYAGKVDGVICGDDRFSEKVLRRFLPRLKIISKWGTGLDSIDLQAASRLGIKVGNTPNAFTLTVAENVLGYILCFARKLPWMDKRVKEGYWGKIPGMSLTELTLGVIGVGNIGKAVLRRARAFGMNLIAYDIVNIAPDFLFENCVKSVDLETLLRESDFISLNCDLNPTSRHLINDKTLSLMKKSCVVINTARGPIIQERSLIKALQEKKIAGKRNATVNIRKRMNVCGNMNQSFKSQLYVIDFEGSAFFAFEI